MMEKFYAFDECPAIYQRFSYQPFFLNDYPMKPIQSIHSFAYQNLYYNTYVCLIHQPLEILQYGVHMYICLLYYSTSQLFTIQAHR